MESIIKQIFLNKRGNCESIVNGKNYFSALEVVCEKDEEIRAHLRGQPNLLKLYQEVLDSLGNMNCIDAEEHYVEGLKVGALLGLEICGCNFE